MRSRSPIISQSIIALLALVAACQAGLWSHAISGRPISPIWPYAGVAYGLLLALGPRWVILAGLGAVMPLRIYGVPWTASLLYPVVDSVQALLGWWMVYRLAPVEPGRGVCRAAWAFLLVPALTSSVAAALALAILDSQGHPMGSDRWMNLAMVASSRMAGMIALAPLSMHFFRGDFFLIRGLRPPWIGPALQVLLVLFAMLGFAGSFCSVMPAGGAVYLPFLAMLLVGVFCSQAQAAVSLFLLAVISTVMTVAGHGPLVPGDDGAGTFHLAIYQAGLGGFAYLLATGSRSMLESDQLLKLMTGSGRLGTWSWSRRDGLRLEVGKTDFFPDCLPAIRLEPRRSLEWLGYRPPAKAEKQGKTHWTRWMEMPRNGRTVFIECQGIILGWDPGGHPAAAVGVFHDLTEVRESQATKAELARQTEKLRGLQSQLNPHLLFNSLNTVRALIGDDPEAARASVAALASILRATLKFEARSKIPLREELQVIRHFLRLQGLRHGARLRSRIRVTRTAAMCPVPPLIVLNMVENATIHGIEKTLGGGRIDVSCHMDGRFLLIQVRNPGEFSPDCAGIGVENARQRLEILYAPEATFEVSGVGGGQVLASARLPVFPAYENPSH